MKDLILYYDFLGYEPNLHVSGRSRFRTVVTGVMSIVLSAIFIACTFYFGSDLILKTTPLVNKTTNTVKNFDRKYFSNESHNIMIGLQDQNYTYFVDPTIFQVSAFLNKVTNMKSLLTGETEQIIQLDPIKMDLCSKFYKDRDIIEKNMAFPLNVYYCPEPNAAYMEGFWASDEFTALRVFIKKCTNTTENLNRCKPQEVIDKTVQG